MINCLSQRLIVLFCEDVYTVIVNKQDFDGDKGVGLLPKSEDSSICFATHRITGDESDIGIPGFGSNSRPADRRSDQWRHPLKPIPG